MLTSLNIHNFSLIEHLEIEFLGGTSAISGKTGAGKSLILDALAMTLGGRADTDALGLTKGHSEISASFDITKINRAASWLHEEQFTSDNDCVLRRVFNEGKRTRAYINGRACTMQQLQKLSSFLIGIHSQHEHQSLMRQDNYRFLLDDYAGATASCAEVNKIAGELNQIQQDIVSLESSSNKSSDRLNFLQFQIEEWEKLAVAPDEFDKLEEEQKLLSNSENLLLQSHRLLNLCGPNTSHNIRDSLSEALSILRELSYLPKSLENVSDLLRSCLIQVEEATYEIKTALENLYSNPQKLAEVNERISAIFQLSRKHRVPPNQLDSAMLVFKDELKALERNEQKMKTLQKQYEKTTMLYKDRAQKLSNTRQLAAKKMASEINLQLAKLEMKDSELMIKLVPRNDSNYHPSGSERIEFLISTNRGQPHNQLHKVVSGGELSRISLAIQIVAAEHSKIPTLVLDEVDVGIGGATAEIIGRLLKKLGSISQVITITHLPQVASHANNHYVAQKQQLHSEKISTTLTLLNDEDRVEEISRMLGGINITEKTRGHAHEMLALAQKIKPELL